MGRDPWVEMSPHVSWVASRLLRHRDSIFANYEFRPDFLHMSMLSSSLILADLFMCFRFHTLVSDDIFMSHIESLLNMTINFRLSIYMP